MTLCWGPAWGPRKPTRKRNRGDGRRAAVRAGLTTLLLLLTGEPAAKDLARVKKDNTMGRILLLVCLRGCEKILYD